MSKIGRKVIDIKDTQVTINGQEVHYKGKKSSGVYVLPEEFTAQLADKKLRITPKSGGDVARNLKTVWGTARATLANKIGGSSDLFEKKIQINGLGFKAALMGKKLELTLGFSHKVVLAMPEGLSLEIDKTGQLLTFKGSDKELVGAFCDAVRSSRPPEPYKGTGVKLMEEHIIRKAGKAKTAGA